MITCSADGLWTARSALGDGRVFWHGIMSEENVDAAQWPNGCFELLVEVRERGGKHVRQTGRDCKLAHERRLGVASGGEATAGMPMLRTSAGSRVSLRTVAIPRSGRERDGFRSTISISTWSPAPATGRYALVLIVAK